jgi:teichuronic acid biosynthesis glycosyltransferase TuaC
MKVLVVTNMYPTAKSPFYGIFVREQVEALKAAGIDPDVYFINGRENRLNYLKSILALTKRLRRRRYDLIHAHHSYCVFPVKVAEKLAFTSLPLILTFHEGEVHLPPDLKLKKVPFIRRLVFSRRIKQAALQMTDMVVGVQEEMLKRLDFKGPSVVLPCGVDCELFKPLDQQWCRRLLGLPPEKKIILFPAPPGDRQKGIDILKAALRRIAGNDLMLVTAGNIPHEKMPYYMNAADVVVQLSRYEASPSVLKEALAVNTPAVFTAAGDAAKLINATSGGYYLSPRDPANVAACIVKALGDNGNCDGRASIIKADLTLNAVAGRIVRIYRRLLKARE